ncbi:hypothetical protein TcCL_Unassigned05237 [Trypanosoma cruzi]|nr:hypothetical protein TcCL_Unassigned05237 [Trypanosoma cruzi]
MTTYAYDCGAHSHGYYCVYVHQPAVVRVVKPNHFIDKRRNCRKRSTKPIHSNFTPNIVPSSVEMIQQPHKQNRNHVCGECADREFPKATASILQLGQQVAGHGAERRNDNRTTVNETHVQQVAMHRSLNRNGNHHRGYNRHEKKNDVGEAHLSPS